MITDKEQIRREVQAHWDRAGKNLGEYHTDSMTTLLHTILTGDSPAAPQPPRDKNETVIKVGDEVKYTDNPNIYTVTELSPDGTLGLKYLFQHTPKEWITTRGGAANCEVIAPPSEPSPPAGEGKLKWEHYGPALRAFNTAGVTYEKHSALLHWIIDPVDGGGVSVWTSSEKIGKSGTKFGSIDVAKAFCESRNAALLAECAGKDANTLETPAPLSIDRSVVRKAICDWFVKSRAYFCDDSSGGGVVIIDGHFFDFDSLIDTVVALYDSQLADAERRGAEKQREQDAKLAESTGIRGHTGSQATANNIAGLIRGTK